MPTRVATIAILALLAALTPSVAQAGRPPEGPSPPDGNKHHVHKLKPWKAKLQYRMEENQQAYTELNARSDHQAAVVKGQWWPIDCQLLNQTQRGLVLWNHIANVGWVPDQSMKTYSDGRLEGSPTCAKPGPNHVYFKQPWAAPKEYRFKQAAVVRDRPRGAPVGKGFAQGAWTAITCHVLEHKQQYIRVRFNGGAGYVKRDALNFWQPGRPAGLPACAKAPPAPKKRWYVAMGDSYASGQGTDNYDLDENCARSSDAYPALLRPFLKHGIDIDPAHFVACTGATTDDVLDDQLGPLSSRTRLVTLGIGGNNLGFSGVLQACVLPGGTSCSDAIDGALTTGKLRGLRRDLGTTYRAIRRRAPKAQVLVLGYPALVGDHVDSCGALDDGNVDEIHHATRTINANIRRAIGKRRGFRFVGLVKTFRNHPACNDDSDDWINGVSTGDKTKDSFHPDQDGHRAIARHLADIAPKFFR